MFSKNFGLEHDVPHLDKRHVDVEGVHEDFFHFCFLIPNYKLGKVTKFQGVSPFRLGVITIKPQGGWIPPPPPSMIGLRRMFHLKDVRIYLKNNQRIVKILAF